MILRNILLCVLLLCAVLTASSCSINKGNSDTATAEINGTASTTEGKSGAEPGETKRTDTAAVGNLETTVSETSAAGTATAAETTRRSERTRKNTSETETDAPALNNTVAYVVKNNTNKTAYDVIRSFTLDDLGISKSSLSSGDNISFTVDGRRVSAYLSDETYWVRIPEISANGEKSVKVTYGGTEKTEFNGSDVFEIVGGDVKLIDASIARTALTVCKNGDLITGKCSNGGFTVERSTDGGLTWSASTQIREITYKVENGEWIKDSTGKYNKERRISSADLGGFISNTKTGDLFLCINEYLQYTCVKLDANGNVWLNSEGRSETDTERSKFESVNQIWKSTDNGRTWKQVCSLKNENDKNKPLYSLFYGNGIIAPSYDGSGPSVDYVYAVSGSDDSANNFYNTSIYSCDNGLTWKYSKSKLTLSGGSTVIEGGLSEPTVSALKDGRLVMIMRNQAADSIHFAVSYSSDNGMTWSKPVLSEVFAPNTQPLLDTCGTSPVLLWGGNNVLGGTSYMRYPFSLAKLDDKNAQEIEALYDISLGSSLLQKYSRSLFTNPALLIFDYKGTTRLVAMGGANCRGCVVISDLENYFKRTKGGFDSFENGMGSWVVLPIHSGNTITSTGRASSRNSGSASDGSYILAVSENSTVSRSFGKSAENGCVQIDFAITSGGKTAFELQTALNDVLGKNPYLSVTVGDGNKLSVNGVGTSLKANDGMNCLIIEFESKNHNVKVTLNGKTVEQKANTEYGDLVSYFNVTTSAGTTCELDRFILVDNG